MFKIPSSFRSPRGSYSEFNIPSNKSATFEGSGSDWVGSNLEYFSTVLQGIEETSSAYPVLGHHTKYEEYQSNTLVTPAIKLENFVTHSDFHSYVTTLNPAILVRQI